MNILRHKERLKQFLVEVNDYISSYFKSIGAPEFAFKVTSVLGKKYIRLEGHLGDTVWTWGFLDVRNGDCLKAASYKSPSTKTPRGNIFHDDLGMSHVTWTGFSPIESGSGWPHGLRLESVYMRKKRREK